MVRLTKLLRDVLGDRRGNVAMIFAICLVPLLLMAGFALDYRQASTTRSVAQDAADAAVLAASLTYFSTMGTPEEKLAAAQNSANAMMNTMTKERSDKGETFTWVLTKSEAGELQVDVTGRSSTTLLGMVGKTYLDFKATSGAAAGGKPVEITLMLDNTSSMFDAGRFNIMRSAAKEYVNQVFDLGGDRVKISVVPWTTLVNINSEAVQEVNFSAVAATSPAMAGTRKVPSDPAVARLGSLKNPRNTANLTQATLDDLDKPVDWRGCVRSADNEVKTSTAGAVTKVITDDLPASRWPVALLEPTVTKSQRTYCTLYKWVDPAPSTPSTPSTPSPSPPPPTMEGALDLGFGPRFVRASWTPSRNPYLQPAVYDDYKDLWIPTAAAQVRQCQDSPKPTSPYFSCLGTPANGTLHSSGTLNAYFADTQDCSSTSGYSADGLSDKVPVKTGTNLPCVSDPNEFKYLNNGGRICSWEQDAFTGFNSTTWKATPNYNSQVPISGPNLNCPAALLPLSSNRAQVITKLDEMYPVPGGTQADVGLLWGLRSLSPKWSSFWALAGEKVASAFKNGKTLKIAILLTDGANVAPTYYEGYYGCTKTGRGGRAGNCWKSPNVATLDKTTVDNLMVSACTQMRTVYGVDLYYILVDVDDAAAQALATKCAPDAGHSISTSSGELSDVFRGLVSRQLHLTR